MKEATVIWAKIFLILIISAKPLGLNGLSECKRLGNNSCLSNNECCSGYCYKEPGWEMGVCKKAVFEGDDSQQTESVFEKGVCGYYKVQLTANGDLFDESDLTAAHRTLPFNTKVRMDVMGGSVVVRINDRLKDSNSRRILDISRAAAEYVDITKNGAVPCEITIVNEVGCTPDLGNTCLMDHECCSNYCFREMFAEAGFCIPS